MMTDEIVNYRQVPSCPRYWVGDDGTVWSAYYKRFLLPVVHERGYLRVGLQHGKKQHMYRVHSLVLLAFCGPCPEGHEACHANDIKIDNRLENLRWGTHSENVRDAYSTGVQSKCLGEAHGQSKLTTDQVREIRRLRGVQSQSQVARQFGISTSQVSDIQLRKKWRHI